MTVDLPRGSEIADDGADEMERVTKMSVKRVRCCVKETETSASKTQGLKGVTGRGLGAREIGWRSLDWEEEKTRRESEKARKGRGKGACTSQSRDPAKPAKGSETLS
jgi:hypothetical protein